MSVLELRFIIHLQALAFTSQWQCCFIRINSVGTHLFMVGPESFHFSQGPQHQKWHYLSSLQTVSAGIMHHVCSWKPHCVLLGEWEQEAENKLAWWEWLWSCKYRESSLPTKVASFWCGKNNDVGRDLGFDEEENRPYWILWLTCLNSWLYLWGFSFGRWWKFGDVGFIKEKWITRSRLWRLNSLLFLSCAVCFLVFHNDL